MTDRKLREDNLVTALKLGMINWFQYLEAFRLMDSEKCDHCSRPATMIEPYGKYCDECWKVLSEIAGRTAA